MSCSHHCFCLLSSLSIAVCIIGYHLLCLYSCLFLQQWYILTQLSSMLVLSIISLRFVIIFHKLALPFSFCSLNGCMGLFSFKQTIDEARDYNTRRIKEVQEHITQIEQMIQKKRALRDGATFVLQQKIAQQTSRH